MADAVDENESDASQGGMSSLLLYKLSLSIPNSVEYYTQTTLLPCHDVWRVACGVWRVIYRSNTKVYHRSNAPPSGFLVHTHDEIATPHAST